MMHINKKVSKMREQPLFVAFSNQKGGVGKSAFTVLMAGYFHYLKNCRVLVVDADYPQHSIHAMRERDKQIVCKNDFYKQLLVKQCGETNRKAYPILLSRPDDARETADKLLESSNLDYDLVLFDLPGTVNTPGLFQSLVNMDYIFTPIVADRMAMQSSLSFATTIQDYIRGRQEVPLQGLYLLWNMVDSRVSKELFELYSGIMKRLNLNVLETVMPHTQRYSKELSITGKSFFRSTLFPPTGNLLRGSKLDVLVEEISQLIKL
jgi:cellulose biosynthesis protein BcsQ